MKHFRLIAFLIVVAAALGLPVAATTAPVDQVKGPPCGDITFWDDVQSGPPAYSTNHGTAPPTVFASLTTAKPSCAKATYTISVYDATGTTLLTSQTYLGDGTTSVFQFTYSPPGAPQQVCVSASSSRDGKVIDAAPNSGCFVLVLDASGGQSGLN
jgi:hypothetical protein